MEENQKKPCEHEWEAKKESVPVDNLLFKKSDAYFIMRVCKLCSKKIKVDYVIE